MSARDELAETTVTTAETTSSTTTPAPGPAIDAPAYWARPASDPANFKSDDEWQPAFPGQRRAFAAGNTASMKTGHRSERTVSEIAAQKLEELLRDNPELAAPRWRSTVEALAREEARLEVHHAHEDKVGLFDARGNTRSHQRDVGAVENRAAARRSELALTPTSYAKLMRDSSTAAALHGGAENILARALAEGRAAIERVAAAELEQAAGAAADGRDERDEEGE